MKHSLLLLVFLACANIELTAQSILSNNTTLGGPDSMSLSDDINICRGTSTELSVHRISGAIAYFTWSPMVTLAPSTPGNDSTMIATPITPTTVYYVEGHRADSSVATFDSVIVYLLPKPNVYATSDTIIAPGEVITLTGWSNGIFLTWQQNSDTLAYNMDFVGLRSLTMTDSTPSSGPYLFIARGLNGWLWCMDTAIVNVTVEEEDCAAEFFVPNAFTPNGDGRNETFSAKGYNITDFHMMIFDRWGNLLFESIDIDHGWDGSVKGRVVQQDVYVVRAEYRKCGKEEVYYGHVTVVR